MLAEENAHQSTEAIDLKMLGWTVPRQLSHLTSIDSNNVYHCKVGRKAMWECNWTYNGGGTNLFYSSDFYDGKTAGMCVYLKYDGITGGNFRDNWGILLNEESYSVTYINASGYTDAEALKQLLKNENVYLYYELETPITMTIDGNETVTQIKNDLDKLNSLPIGSIIQIEADKDNIETTEQKYGWQYLGTSNIECEDGALIILVTNVYRKNN